METGGTMENSRGPRMPEQIKFDAEEFNELWSCSSIPAFNPEPFNGFERAMPPLNSFGALLPTIYPNSDAPFTSERCETFPNGSIGEDPELYNAPSADLPVGSRNLHQFEYEETFPIHYEDFWQMAADTQHGCSKDSPRRLSGSSQTFSAGNMEGTPAALQRRLKYRCDIGRCEMKYGRQSELTKHQKIHENKFTRPYRCDMCDRAFLWPKDLRRHKRSVHGEGNETHYCPHTDCPYSEQGERGFSRKDKLGRHLKRKHATSTI